MEIEERKKLMSSVNPVPLCARVQAADGCFDRECAPSGPGALIISYEYLF